MKNVLDVIRKKIIYQKENDYKGKFLFITTEALNILKAQAIELYSPIGKITEIFGLKIWELTSKSNVSFSKYDVYIDEDILKDEDYEIEMQEIRAKYKPGIKRRKAIRDWMIKDAERNKNRL